MKTAKVREPDGRAQGIDTDHDPLLGSRISVTRSATSFQCARSTADVAAVAAVRASR
jgi:hypothetical protein